MRDRFITLKHYTRGGLFALIFPLLSACNSPSPSLHGPSAPSVSEPSVCLHILTKNPQVIVKKSEYLEHVQQLACFYGQFFTWGESYCAIENVGPKYFGTDYDQLKPETRNILQGSYLTGKLAGITEVLRTQSLGVDFRNADRCLNSISDLPKRHATLVEFTGYLKASGY